jgi:uncharacterized protein YjbK
MSREIEYEKRVLINEDQYKKILRFFLKKYPDYKSFKQTNYYFDTCSFDLKNKGIVFRLRKTKKEYPILTLKIKGSNGDLEINQVLTSKEKKCILNNIEIPEGEIKDYLSHEGLLIYSLHLLGLLKTKRMEIKFDDFLIVLDKNEYLETCDYNLEIEANSIKRAESIILELCGFFALEYKKDYSSKSNRLFKLLEIK